MYNKLNKTTFSYKEKLSETNVERYLFVCIKYTIFEFQTEKYIDMP